MPPMRTNSLPAKRISRRRRGKNSKRAHSDTESSNEDPRDGGSSKTNRRSSRRRSRGTKRNRRTSTRSPRNHRSRRSRSPASKSRRVASYQDHQAQVYQRTQDGGRSQAAAQDDRSSGQQEAAQSQSSGVPMPDLMRASPEQKDTRRINIIYIVLRVPFYYNIKSKYDGIDILVNNAAIAFKNNATEPVSVQAEQTLFVNYFSLVSTCDILFPILKKGARVVNISSSAAHLSGIPSKQLREQLKDPNLSVPELSKLMQQYVDAAKEGTHAAEWGNSSYVVSKVGVTALSNIQQRMLADRDIKVNSVHPGYVDTDMTSHKGPLTIDEGAAAPLFLALDAADSVQGQYVWYNKEIVSWDGQKPE